MADTSELKIITDETLMEKRTHGQSVFPFQYYLEDIWDFDLQSVGIGIRKLNLYMCKAVKCNVISEKIISRYQQAVVYLSTRKSFIN